MEIIILIAIAVVFMLLIAVISFRIGYQTGISNSTSAVLETAQWLLDAMREADIKPDQIADLNRRLRIRLNAKKYGV